MEGGFVEEVAASLDDHTDHTLDDLFDEVHTIPHTGQSEKHKAQKKNVTVQIFNEFRNSNVKFAEMYPTEFSSLPENTVNQKLVYSHFAHYLIHDYVAKNKQKKAQDNEGGSEQQKAEERLSVGSVMNYLGILMNAAQEKHKETGSTRYLLC